MLRIRSVVGLKTFYTVENDIPDYCCCCWTVTQFVSLGVDYQRFLCVWVESVVETWAQLSSAVNRQRVVDASPAPDKRGPFLE